MGAGEYRIVKRSEFKGTASRRYPYVKVRKKGDFLVRVYGIAPRFACAALGLLSIAVGVGGIRLWDTTWVQGLSVAFIIIGAASCFTGGDLQMDLRDRRWRELFRVVFVSKSMEGSLDEDAEGLEIVSTGNYALVQYYVTLRWKDPSRSRWSLAWRFDYGRAHRDLTRLAADLSLPITERSSGNMHERPATGATIFAPTEERGETPGFGELPEPPRESRIQILQAGSTPVARIPLTKRVNVGLIGAAAIGFFWSGFWSIGMPAAAAEKNFALLAALAFPVFIGAAVLVCGVLFGLSQKAIELYHEGVEVTWRMFGRKWRKKEFLYRSVQELRRFPVPQLGKWILVARIPRCGFELGKELFDEELAWLETVLHKATASYTSGEGWA